MEQSAFYLGVFEKLDTIDDVLAPVFKYVELGDPEQKNIPVLENKMGTKNKMAELILKLSKELKSCRDVLKQGGVIVQKLQGDLLTQVEKENSEMKSLLENYSNQSKRLENIETSVKDSENKKLDFSKLDFKTPIKRAVNESVKNVMKEKNQSKHLILHDFSENDGDPDTDDEKWVKDMLKRGLGFDSAMLNDVISCERFGKYDSGKIRPLLVKFDKEETVDRAIRRAPNLKTAEGGEFSFVYINRKRTKEERQQRKELVAKMKSLIAKNPSIKWIIRNNHVINGGTYHKI